MTEIEKFKAELESLLSFIETLEKTDIEEEKSGKGELNELSSLVESTKKEPTIRGIITRDDYGIWLTGYNKLDRHIPIWRLFPEDFIYHKEVELTINNL